MALTRALSRLSTSSVLTDDRPLSAVVFVSESVVVGALAEPPTLMLKLAGVPLAVNEPDAVSVSAVTVGVPPLLEVSVSFRVS